MWGTGEGREELNTHKKQSNTVANDKERERVTSGALMKKEAVALEERPQQKESKC